MMLAGLQDGRAIAERPAQAFTICQHTTKGKPIAERLVTIWLDDAGRSSGWQGHCRASGYDLA
jgi:hypothetical protein